jgi:hypothetical protein
LNSCPQDSTAVPERLRQLDLKAVAAAVTDAPVNDGNKPVHTAAEVAAAAVYPEGRETTAEEMENVEVEPGKGSRAPSQQEKGEEQVAAEQPCGWKARVAAVGTGRRMREKWLLRGGGGDGQEENAAASAAVGVMTVGGVAAGALAARGADRSLLSDEACAALGVPKGSRWATAAGDGRRLAMTVKATDIAMFDEAADDDALLKHVFDKIDTDRNARISKEELSNALQSETSKELVEALKKAFERDGSSEINFERFKAGASQVSVPSVCSKSLLCGSFRNTKVNCRVAAQVPRVKGERVQWVRTLGLEGLLAKHLPLGNFVDQLNGIKTMAEEELSVAVHRFIAELPAVVSAGLKKLKGRAASQFGSKVQEHINSKFTLDGAFVGKFATLDDFYKGPEELIGTPNPKIMQGMHAEHCLRGNSQREFTTSNYNLTTTPATEWEFVVEPRDEVAYPHTPKDKAQWPKGMNWKGKSGREAEDVEVIMQRKQVTLAGLLKVEVIALRLYTGPMFVLYNAVLRGFPEGYVECLKDTDGKENRYETTIFAIASGITKLSKVSDIPRARRLYRGLGGMILPRQFWEHYPECQVTFTVAVNGAATTVLEKLKGYANTKLSENPNQAAGKDSVGGNEAGKGYAPGSPESGSTRADAQAQTAEAAGTARAIFDVSAQYLPIELPEASRQPQSRQGVRVVKEARQEGEVVRMSVALPFAKGYFVEKLEACFQKSIRELCGGGQDVRIEAVADKPKDFRGGGADLRKTFSAPTVALKVPTLYGIDVVSVDV